MTFLLLFLEFFKTGLFSIGGGMATLPFLNEMAQNYTWFTVEQLSDMIAISESTPGPIGVNMAAYAGYSGGFAEYGFLGGLLGAVCAAIGLVSPSVIIIIIISKILDKFRQNKFVNDSFYTLRPAVTALIAVAGISIAQTVLLNQELFLESYDFSTLLNYTAIIMFIAILFCQKIWKKIHPMVYIGAAALLGIILQM